MAQLNQTDGRNSGMGTYRGAGTRQRPKDDKVRQVVEDRPKNQNPEKVQSVQKR